MLIYEASRECVMPKEPARTVDETTLSKGHIRKLTALRKSLGQEIADKAFAEWFAQFGRENVEAEDRNAKLILATLEPLVMGNKLKIPRGGYVVRRGRGRVIVEPARPN